MLEAENMLLKFVPLEVSSGGIDSKLRQFENILLKFVFLAKFNFGIDINAAHEENNEFASVTFIVSNHGMVTKLLQLANIELIFVKLRVFVKIGNLLSAPQDENILPAFVHALKSIIDGNDSNW